MSLRALRAGVYPPLDRWESSGFFAFLRDCPPQAGEAVLLSVRPCWPLIIGATPRGGDPDPVGTGRWPLSHNPFPIYPFGKPLSTKPFVSNRLCNKQGEGVPHPPNSHAFNTLERGDTHPQKQRYGSRFPSRINCCQSMRKVIHP